MGNLLLFVSERGPRPTEAPPTHFSHPAPTGALVRSIMMPPPPVITAVPVKGIIYPTSLGTVWRSPKRMSPYGAHHTADDRTGRAGDEEARSRAKHCAN